MNIFLKIILVFVIFNNANAQLKNYSLFKKNGKYGLLNSMKKVVVKNDFDTAYIVKKNYFVFKKDLKEGRLALNNENKYDLYNHTYSLYRGEKLLVEEVRFPNFLIFNNYLCASYNPYRCDDDTVIFNLQGKPILEKEVKAFEESKDYVGNLNDLSKTEKVFIIVKSRWENRTWSAGVFDRKTMEFKRWLIEDVKDMRTYDHGDYLLVVYGEKGNKTSKFINFNKSENKFEVIDYSDDVLEKASRTMNRNSEGIKIPY